MGLYHDIYEVVKQIPPGSVSSYGRIAKLVGTGPRQVGYAMAATPPGEGMPWHRVINSQGRISARKDGQADNPQKRLLMDEGVVFDHNERVDFSRFGWDPEETLFIEEEWLDAPYGDESDDEGRAT